MPSLDVLAQRGSANGATVEFLDETQLRQLIPEARSASGRSLWSPNTAVVKPREVVIRLEQELRERGVSFIKGCAGWTAKPKCRELLLADGGHDQLRPSHQLRRPAGRPGGLPVRGGPPIHLAPVQGPLLAAQRELPDSTPLQPLPGT